jgi:hypothetical protein
MFDNFKETGKIEITSFVADFLGALGANGLPSPQIQTNGMKQEPFND